MGRPARRFSSGGAAFRGLLKAFRPQSEPKEKAESRIQSLGRSFHSISKLLETRAQAVRRTVDRVTRLRRVRGYTILPRKIVSLQFGTTSGRHKLENPTRKKDRSPFYDL